MYNENKLMEEELQNTNENDNRATVQKKEATKKIRDILAYISKEVGCEFPKGFEKHLYQESIGREFFRLNKCHANGIIDDWKIWAPFVLEEDAGRYIAHKLEVLCKIHCGVTYGYVNGEATSKSYIGNYATVVKEVPANMYTIIHSSGLVSLDGRVCPVDPKDPRAAFTNLRK